ncbi:heme peroxidase [Chloropicon primus]|uniref:Heme peroxidase n=1 Tax=Chloropicon primus TaxID=1764295 RepID=A0A5B8MTG2_9CHLO|nr:heme peroxidase [Chloropicon primus]|eukprot:QDZ22692.1 heme peroxidase [Chloropicon primus]
MTTTRTTRRRRTTTSVVAALLPFLFLVHVVAQRAQQSSTTSYSYDDKTWTPVLSNFEPTVVEFQDPGTGVTYRYPGRTGEAGAFPVNGNHAHTEYCSKGPSPPSSSFEPGTQLPVGSSAASSLEVGSPVPAQPACSTSTSRATPREVSNNLHGSLIQQAHSTVNHVTSATLQTMAHDIGIGNTVPIQFAYGPLLVLEPAGTDSLDRIIFFGGAAFTNLPGRTVDETLQELQGAIRAKWPRKSFSTPISSTDDVFNAFREAAGAAVDSNATDDAASVQSFLEFGMTAVAIEPLLSCNYNSTTVTSEDGATHEVYDVSSGFGSLCDDRRHVNDVSPQLDASHVYGSDLRTADALRERDPATGELGCRMRVHRGGDALGTLPTIADLDERDRPFFRQVTDTFHRCHSRDYSRSSDVEGCRDEDLPVAGDRRSNENFYLSALHNVLLRRHNQWCDSFEGASSPASGWSEDHKYHEARVRVMAVYQHAFVLSSIDFAGLVSLGQDRKGSGHEGDDGIAGREVYEVFVPDMAKWNETGALVSEEHDECDEAVACGVSISNWLDRFQQWPVCQDVMTNLMLRWHPALYDEMAVVHGASWGFEEEEGEEEACLSEHDGLEEEEEEEEEGKKLVDIGEGINTIIAQPDIHGQMKTSGGLADFLRSAISTHANGNVGFPQSMRNILFGKNAVLDLAALNIARFRERGVVTVWDALSYMYPDKYPRNATEEAKMELRWEDLALDPRVEPQFRAMFCNPWEAEAYSVAISQKQDGWVLTYEDPDFGIFPGDNDGMGLGSVAMARYLSGARNFFGFMERFWLLERVEGEYPKEVKEESLRFYNTLAADQGFEDSIRELFMEAVPELREGCMPNNIWHTPLASDFMEADTGARSERCNALTQNFRVLHEASPCLQSKLLEATVEGASGWSAAQVGIVAGIGGFALCMTILSMILGVVLLTRNKKTIGRVTTLEKHMLSDSDSGKLSLESESTTR